QAARSPVVAIVPIASDGERFLPGGFCSGALVTVNDILTSAHCFVDPIQRGEELGRRVVAFVAIVGGSGGEALPIVKAAIHPSYDGQVTSRFDVAMATISKVPS